MTALIQRNRIIFLLAVLATALAVTTGLLNVMAAHAWLPDAPTTDAGGVINSDTTWTLAGSPYVLTETLTVAAGVTLTVEPGVVVMGQLGTSLVINGRLEAVGTTTAPITFTSAADTGPGEWSGVRFFGGTGHLNYTLARYTSSSESIIIDGSPNDGPVIIENSAIQDNLGYPMMVRPEDLHRLQMSNVSFTGNNKNRVIIGGDPFSNVTLTEDVTLSGQPGLEGYEVVDFVIIVPAGITMTLQPGTTIMATDSGYCPISVAEQGHLEAVGTSEAPVTFTSTSDSSPGEWGDICVAGSAHFDWTEFRYGLFNLDIWGPMGGEVFIENSAIISSSLYSVWAYADSIHRLRMSNVTFSGNARNRVLIDTDSGNSLVNDVTLTAQPGLEGYEFNAPDLPVLQVPASVTLTMEPGTTLMAPENTGAVIQVFDQGHLNARGTADSPVTFTSATDSGPGEWVGLTIAGSAELDHAVVRNGALNIGIFENNNGEIRITNSVISNSSEYPMIVGPDALHRLQMSNVAFSENLRNRILIEPGPGNESLAGNATLTAQPGLEGYVIKPWNAPTPQLAIPAGITLTAAPGVTVMTAENTPINVAGHLEAKGTAVSPVTFTSITDTLPGEWTGLIISGTASLDHAVIRNGISNIGLLGATGGSVNIADSFIENGASYAIYSDIVALHRLRMSHVTFSGNNPDRVYVYPDDGYLLTNDVELTSQPGLEGYEVNLANFAISEGITLTLRSGATLMMNNGVIPVAGHLAAEGTADAPVTFTSATDSGPGEWAGIVLEGGTAVIDHAQIRNTGKGGQSSIRVGGYVTEGGDLALRNSTIVGSAAAGLSAYGGQVTAVCTTFSNNTNDAIYVAGSPDVTVFSSSISGNGSGINNVGSTAVDARQNWWGDASGPGGVGPGGGDAIWGNVLYDPWLNEPTCNLTPYQLFLPAVMGP